MRTMRRKGNSGGICTAPSSCYSPRGCRLPDREISRSPLSFSRGKLSLSEKHFALESTISTDEIEIEIWICNRVVAMASLTSLVKDARGAVTLALTPNSIRNLNPDPNLRPHLHLHPHSHPHSNVTFTPPLTRTLNRTLTLTLIPGKARPAEWTEWGGGREDFALGGGDWSLISSKAAGERGGGVEVRGGRGGSG